MLHGQLCSMMLPDMRDQKELVLITIVLCVYMVANASTLS